MPSLTGPMATRFRRATSRPKASHIFRISRFLPSYSTISSTTRPGCCSSTRTLAGAVFLPSMTMPVLIRVSCSSVTWGRTVTR